MNQNSAAAIHYEPSLQMEFRPGFRCCGIPNPNGLAKCPSCGGPSSQSMFQDADDVAMTIPLAARVALAIGNFLRKVARRVQGDDR